MITTLEYMSGVKVLSAKTKEGISYAQYGDQINMSKNKDALLFLAQRIRLTLAHLKSSFCFEHEYYPFSWILRDVQSKGVYALASSHTEKQKSLMLSLELADHNLIEKVEAQRISRGSFYLVAERLKPGLKRSNIKYFTDSIIRHELGHFLTQNTHLKSARTIKNKHSSEWITTNISEYANKEASEFLAEIFTLVTSKEYQSGTLPKDIENLALDLMDF